MPPGAYQVVGGVPRRIYLKEARWGDQDALSQDVVIEDHVAPLRLVFSTHTASVTAIVEGPGAGSPTARVVLVPEESKRYQKQYVRGPAKIDLRTGRFELRSLAPGRYQAIALDPVTRDFNLSREFLRLHRDAVVDVQLSEDDHQVVTLPLVRWQEN